MPGFAQLMINLNHQNHQTRVVKIANDSIIADAIPPQTGHSPREGFASVPGALECRDCSECFTDTSSSLGVSFPKPFRCVG